MRTIFSSEFQLFCFGCIALGWVGNWILIKNTNKHFLSVVAFRSISLVSIVLEMFGAIGCLRALFGI